MHRCTKTAKPRFVASVVCVAASLLSCVPASPQDKSDSDLRIAQLDDPKYDTRVLATEALLTDDSLTPEALAEWADAATSLEQQHRLLAVAEHHTLRQLRDIRFDAEGPGSMGVVQTVKEFNEADPARCYALVTRVLPGFPAAGRLRALDRIVALDGQPIPGPADARAFEAMMRQYRAGHELTVTFLRGGETMDVVIPLINGRALAEFYQHPTFALHDPYAQAWRDTRRRLFSDLVPFKQVAAD